MSRVSFKKAWILWLPLCLVLLRILLGARQDWGEFYARHVFRLLSAPFAWLSSQIPFSLGFVFVVLFCPLYFVIRLSVLFSGVFARRHARGERLRYVGRHFYGLGVLLAVLFSLYMLFHGLNFTRMPLAQNLDLKPEPGTVCELQSACEWLAGQAARAAGETERDAGGALLLPEKRAYYLRHAQDGAPELLGGIRVVPKLVPFSHQWSYTQTTGVYIPFFVEANVNVDICADEFLFTALHEVAHAHGFAREDEANFWAFYSGVQHPDPVFRYAAWSSAYLYCSNALYGADMEAWRALNAELDARIKADFARRNQYWAQFEGPVAERAEQVNNHFLQANGEARGVRSYGAVVDLILAYRRGPGADS